MLGFKMLVIGIFIQILATEQIQYPSTIDLQKKSDVHTGETNMSIPETTTIKNGGIIEDNSTPKTYKENSTIYLQVQDNYLQTSLVTCANKIADQYFTNGELVTVFSITEHSVILLILRYLFRTSKTIVWTQNSRILSQERQSNNYIILVQSMEELEKSVEILRNMYWNPHAKILLISPVIFHNLREVSAEMSRVLWKYKAMNAVYLLPNGLNSAVMDIYTWFPYANNSCADNFSQTQLIERCIFGKFQHAVDLFAVKVPKNLNQCLVKVHTVIWPPYVIPPADYNGSLNHVNFADGFEILLMKTIANQLNLTVDYSISDRENYCGYFTVRGQSFGLMHLLHTAQVDLAIGAMATTPMRYKLIDPSIQYGSETLVFCVPTAAEYPKWTTIYHIYTLQTWLVILLAYVVVSTFVRTIGLVKNEQAACFTSWSKCFFNIFAVTLSMSVTHLPRRGTVRFLFLIWCIFSLHLAALYQSSLMRHLVKPLYQRQVKTVEEMLDFGTVSGSYFELRDITGRECPTVLEKRLLQQWVQCDTGVSECLGNVAFARNYSMAVPKHYMTYTSNKYETSNGKSLIYCFQEPLLRYSIVLYGYRGMPFMKRINKILAAMTNSGIMNKWKQDLKRLTKKQYRNDDDGDGVRVITLEHLQGAFLVFIFGIAVSIMAFMMEHLVFYLRQKCIGKSLA